jgi:hypothetical protein
MAKTPRWEDTTRYALMEVDGRNLVFSIAGEVGPVTLDFPDAEADAAIHELVAAGCPVIKSDRELWDLVRNAQGNPVWELSDSSDIGLWQDRWGEIWLRATCGDSASRAVHLSRYEALALAENLMQVAQSAPDVKRCDECGSTYSAQSSQMAQLCPECAHALYGYPACDHTFANGRCLTCGWDGSRSTFARGSRTAP